MSTGDQGEPRALAARGIAKWDDWRHKSLAAVGGLSLRARLMGILTLLVTLALVLSGVATMFALKSATYDSLDSELRTAANPTTLAALTDPQRVFDQGGAENRSPQPSPFFVAIREGNSTTRSYPSADARDHEPDLSKLPAKLAQRQGFTVPSVNPRGPQWRVIVEPVIVRDLNLQADFRAKAAVARPLTYVQETLLGVRLQLIVIAMGVLMGVTLIGLMALNRGLRPLRHLQRAANDFADGKRDTRVSVMAPESEVGRLGSALNDMMDRVQGTLAAQEASESRLRRFVADASHELRTPVACVQGYAELYRLGAVNKPDDVADTFARIEAESQRMGTLVEDLLLLARLDEQRPMREDAVDLLVLADDAVTDAELLAPERKVALLGLEGDQEPDGALVTGDELRLRQVLRNLITNALRHAPGPIEVRVGAYDGWARWLVVDHGPGIPGPDKDQVFERFYRSDTSRSRGGGGGAGLGLAIVAAIVHGHQGHVRVVDTPGGGATFEVALPLRRRAPVPSDNPANQQDHPRT